jgi:hypothetical protein
MAVIDLLKACKYKVDDIDVEAQNQILKNQLLQAKLKAEEAKWLVEMNKLRPCHLYPLTISHDGLQWVCKSTLCEEAVGCGDCPSAAMLAFDTMWLGTQKE